VFESALAVIAGVLGLAVLLGAAYAAFRASDLRATVKDQQARIVSLTTDRDELTRDLQAERDERTLLERRLETAEREIATLKDLVSGRIDFSALETQLAAHHIEVLNRLDEILVGQRDIKALLHATREGDKS
jgi:outer membrane murein-binding lipoprotein Lpp